MTVRAARFRDERFAEFEQPTLPGIGDCEPQFTRPTLPPFEPHSWRRPWPVYRETAHATTLHDLAEYQPNHR